MPYTMDLHATGRSRPNTQPAPIAAAAVTMTNKYGRRKYWTYLLPSTPPPTNLRADLCAIILALEQARAKAQQIHSLTPMEITIRTDSHYAFGCMTAWSAKWVKNGFRNHRRGEVANRDLIARALGLEGEVRRAGTVEWVRVAKDGEAVVERVVEMVLDEMEGGDGDVDDDGDEEAPISPSWDDRLGL